MANHNHQFAHSSSSAICSNLVKEGDDYVCSCVTKWYFNIDGVKTLKQDSVDQKDKAPADSQKKIDNADAIIAECDAVL